MNKQDKNQKLIDTDKSVAVARGQGRWGEVEGVKGVKYMGMEEDLALGGEHTMQCTDDIL